MIADLESFIKEYLLSFMDIIMPVHMKDTLTSFVALCSYVHVAYFCPF